jgi:pyridoxamine 5'-phosphate oxidase
MSTGATIPAWRAAVKHALKRNGRNPTSKYAQIATIDAETGAPRVRTVVIRGFLSEYLSVTTTAKDTAADALVFCTDARSGKIPDIAKDSRSEIAWYFPETREQFRVTGTLTTSASASANEDEARKNLWKKMRRGARGQFLWPTPGGARAVVNDGERDPHDVAEDDPALDDETVSENFTLVALQPTRIDHLHLKKNERYVHEDVNGEWVTTRVNP